MYPKRVSHRLEQRRPARRLRLRLPFERETVIRSGVGFFYGSTVSNTIGDVASPGSPLLRAWSCRRPNFSALFDCATDSRP